MLGEDIKYWKNLSLKNIEGEVWKDIPGFEGEYQASSYGRIKSLERYVEFERNGRLSKRLIHEKIKAQNIIWAGYLRLSVIENKIKCSKFAHRMVAKAFIENKENKPEVNHKNGIKTDNRVLNLEWSTKSENSLHSFHILNRVKPIGMKNKFGSLHHNSKKVLCVNNNIEYGSALEASRITGITVKMIYDQCKRNVTKPKKTNLIFKYV